MVRPARDEDASAIAQVHVATWWATYKGLVPDAYLERLEEKGLTRRWSRWIGGQDRHGVYVAEAGGEVVGFASGGPDRDHPWKDLVGEIYALYVLPEAQGQGHGRELVAGVSQGLADRGMRRITIWALRDNPRARLFYSQLGGAYLGERELRLDEFSLVEAGYGWPDIAALAQLGQGPGRG